MAEESEGRTKDRTTHEGAATLTTTGLVSGYGRTETLHGIDITAPPGIVTAVLGPNGSGKSTLLKTVAGLLPTWRGTTQVDGEPVSHLPAHTLARRGVCTVPQGRVVFPFLTVEENLRMYAYTLRPRTLLAERVEQTYETLPTLAARRTRPAHTLSGGEQVLLSLAKVVLLRPRLLLLDEPSLGLAPRMVELVFSTLTTLAGEGLTTVLVEQNVRAALEIADHAVVLVLGEVRHQGPTEHLAAEIDLGRLFLEGR